MRQESIIKEEGDFGSIDGLLNSTSRTLSNAFRAVRGGQYMPTPSRIFDFLKCIMNQEKSIFYLAQYHWI